MGYAVRRRTAAATVRRSSSPHARVHRQREDLGADAVGFRARGRRLALAAPAASGSEPGSGSASRCPSARSAACSSSRRGRQHREQVVDVPGVALGRHLDAGPVEQLPVEPRRAPAAPRSSPRSNGRRADEDRRLHLVEAAVHAHLAVMVPIGLAAVADALHLRGQRGVAGRDGAAVAEGAEVLRRVEAVGRRDAERPDRPAFARRQVRLAAVLDDREAARRPRSAMMARMSAGWPYRCTGRIAAVRGVMAASIAAGSMVSRRGSMSANTGRAPTIMHASAV